MRDQTAQNSKSRDVGQFRICVRNVRIQFVQKSPKSRETELLRAVQDFSSFELLYKTAREYSADIVHYESGADMFAR